jgi:hypothetical protein
MRSRQKMPFLIRGRCDKMAVCRGNARGQMARTKKAAAEASRKFGSAKSADRLVERRMERIKQGG